MKIDGRHKIATGSYMTLKANKDMSVSVTLDTKWYGHPFLMRRAACEHGDYKWYEYPVLMWLIAEYTVKKWMKLESNQA